MTEGRLFGVPIEVLERHPDWDWSVAWSWLPDSVTWRLQSPNNHVRFLKVNKSGREPSLIGESQRLKWCAPYVPVPQVIETRNDGSTEWLLTKGLPGSDTTSPQSKAEPQRTVSLLAQALREFHESIPVEGCPFDFRIKTALENAERRVEAGLVDAGTDFHAEFQHLNAQTALRELDRLRPNEEDLVVCHGDYCPPNVLIQDWKTVGFLDLGELGVADRWCDVAIGAWSAIWNFGEGLDDVFYESYGVQPDVERITFYRLLYEMSS